MSTTSAAKIAIIERELNQLIKQANRLPVDELEPCKDWTKLEMQRAQKLYDKINRIIIQSSSVISSELFNEARDCCNMIDLWMKRLEINLTQAGRASFHTLADLGKANQQSAQ